MLPGPLQQGPAGSAPPDSGSHEEVVEHPRRPRADRGEDRIELGEPERSGFVLGQKDDRVSPGQTLPKKPLRQLRIGGLPVELPVPVVERRQQRQVVEARAADPHRPSTRGTSRDTTATTSSTPTMSTSRPARAIWRTEIMPDPKTMVLGGVAIGSMNPAEAAKPATSISSTGGCPTDCASAAEIGIIMVATAVLEASSLSTSTVTASPRQITTVGNPPRPAS